MKLLSALLCVWLCAFSTPINAQRVTINNEGGFRHNYVVGSPKYLEDIGDTANLRYVATIVISDNRSVYLQAAGWYELIQIKAKEAGANMMKVVHFQEDSMFVSLTVRTFFAPEKFFLVNEIKQMQSAMVVFNEARIPGRSGEFYLDDQHVEFDSRSYWLKKADLGRTYLIKNNTSQLGAKQKVHFRRARNAEFFVVPLDKRTSISVTPVLSAAPVLIRGAAISFHNNSVHQLHYEVGRFLMDVYSKHGVN